MGKTGYAGSFSGYDEYVPMVDKAVDSSWKKQASLRSPASKGLQVCYFILLLFNNLFDLVFSCFFMLLKQCGCFV